MNIILAINGAIAAETVSILSIMMMVVALQFHLDRHWNFVATSASDRIFDLHSCAGCRNHTIDAQLS